MCISRIVGYSISVSDFQDFDQVGYYAYVRGVPVDICTCMVSGVFRYAWKKCIPCVSVTRTSACERCVKLIEQPKMSHVCDDDMCLLY